MHTHFMKIFLQSPLGSIMPIIQAKPEVLRSKCDMNDIISNTIPARLSCADPINIL